MEYTFDIIPNEQTPKVERVTINENYIKENRELFEEFLFFAEGRANAVGLAANQCSLNGRRFMKRMFAMKIVETGEWELIIDPLIIDYLGMKEQKVEGCLTWIGKGVLADRYRAVNVSYYNIDGEHLTGIFGAFQAQIFQHEYNHIEGIPEEIVEIGYELPPRPKIGRNDQCHCGSGKKYKNCCLKYESIF